MIKLVLTGNRSEFERFKNKLWEKDRDISELRHIESYDSMRGLMYSEHKLLRVGNWRQHPDQHEIIREAYNTGMLARPRTGRRPRTNRRPPFVSMTSIARERSNESVFARAARNEIARSNERLRESLARWNYDD